MRIGIDIFFELTELHTRRTKYARLRFIHITVHLLYFLFSIMPEVSVNKCAPLSHIFPYAGKFIVNKMYKYSTQNGPKDMYEFNAR